MTRLNACLSVPAIQIDALKLMTKAELVSWFMEHRGQTSRKLSVHVRPRSILMSQLWA